jgi:hypothetical protein
MDKDAKAAEAEREAQAIPPGFEGLFDTDDVLAERRSRKAA